jgi:malonate decarboxylase beta subunit
VWRTVGGKHRYLLGEAELLVEDDLGAFRAAAIELLGQRRPLALDALARQQAHLARRLADFGGCGDGLEVWARAGAAEPERLPVLEPAAFRQAVAGARRGDR